MANLRGLVPFGEFRVVLEYNIVTCTSEYRWGLVWWSDLLYILTHNSWLHFTNNYHTDTSVLSHVLHYAAWKCLPRVDDPLPPCSQPRRLAAISHQHPTLLTGIWRLSASCTWSALYNLDMNPTENTFPNSFFIVAWCNYRHGPRIKHHFPQLLHFASYTAVN
jgi:hypothetical protein